MRGEGRGVLALPKRRNLDRRLPQPDPRDQNLRIPSTAATLSVEYLRQAATEPGKHIFALQRAVRVDDFQAAIGAVHMRLSAEGIDDPHEPHTSIEPFADLGE